MPVSRRECLIAPIALAAAASAALPAVSSAGVRPAATIDFPAKSGFLPTDITYLDSATQHPVSLGALEVIDTYFHRRMLDPSSQGFVLDEDGVLARFARLVGASPDEVAYVQSTTAAEQMILRMLDFPRGGGHIVTDTLHYFDSMPLYQEMAKQGCDVTWVRDVKGRIRLEDLRRAFRPDTRLVSLSLVSTYNGFEHDLKAVCDLAHAHGALVYADIVHAAGTIPVDLHAAGVDFAATSTYKWLMGDFGLGFAYVRRDLLPRLKRTNYGYYGIERMQTHVYPLDPPSADVSDYAFLKDATGAFAIGTRSHAVIAQLDYSLSWLETIGVSRIQAYVSTLTAHLKEELPKRGYPLLTPLETRTPIVSVLCANAEAVLDAPLGGAKVRVRPIDNRMRVAPSFFNDHTDIERLLAALPRGSA